MFLSRQWSSCQNSSERFELPYVPLRPLGASAISDLVHFWFSTLQYTQFIPGNGNRVVSMRHIDCHVLVELH